MDYYKKYLKYKNKYQKLKGGVLVFNEFGNDKYKLLRTKVVNNNLEYEVIKGDKSNSFDSEEKKSIETMVNFILPNIEYNGKKLNYEIIKDIEGIGAGTFGLTIANDKLLIKIFKTSSSSSIKEIEELESLFNNPPDISPPYVNKYYGFIAGKNIGDLGKYNKVDTFNNTNINLNSNLFSNPLFKFDSLEFIEKIKNMANPKMTSYLKDNIGKNLIFAFFEKADGDLHNFIKNVLPRHQDIKVQLASTLYTHIREGLSFIHNIKNKAHYDIKTENLVYKTNPDNTITFQIIDFGGLQNIDDKGYGKIGVHTPFYLIDSIYEDSKNHYYMYDYYCLLFAVLEFLGFKNPTPKTIAPIYNLVRDVLGRNLVDTEIDNIVDKLNTTYPDLKLPDSSTNSELLNSYKNIIYLILFTFNHFGNTPIDKFYPDRKSRFIAISSV